MTFSAQHSIPIEILIYERTCRQSKELPKTHGLEEYRERLDPAGEMQIERAIGTGPTYAKSINCESAGVSQFCNRADAEFKVQYLIEICRPRLYKLGTVFR